MRGVPEHSAATLLAARLTELRANARSIVAASRVPSPERERLLRINAAEITRTSAEFRRQTDPERLAGAADTRTRGGCYRRW